MPATEIDGCSITYELLGSGTPLVLTPGGRNPIGTARRLAEALAASFQVLLWDRANIGTSDVQFRGARDVDLWADQLAALVRRLQLAPVFLCAPSAGSRVSLTTALHYPELVRGMYLWLVSGGPVGKQLGRNYYGQYAELATTSGMQAVIDSPYWSERIAANPANDRAAGPRSTRVRGRHAALAGRRPGSTTPCSAPPKTTCVASACRRPFWRRRPAIRVIRGLPPSAWRAWSRRPS